MISYLEGTIKHKGPNYLILLTDKVGYKVFVPTKIINNIQIGAELSIYTYTNVKDDAIELFGFENQEALALFELFLTVPGIGPRLALSIFSNSVPEKIKEAIVKGDVEFFSSLPRLGRKNSQKIIIELRNKLGSKGELDLSQEGGENKEIMDALRTFGFSSSEAKEAVKSVMDLKSDTSAKIKEALKFLGKR